MTEEMTEETTVKKGKTITFEYTLALDNGEILDSSKGRDPMTFTHGSSQIIPGLEDQMGGMKPGDTKKITVQPEDGYGFRLEEAVIDLKIEQVPVDSRRVGAILQTQSPEGQVVRGRITKIEQEKATLDLNHPLAGETLFFDVKILNIK